MWRILQEGASLTDLVGSAGVGCTLVAVAVGSGGAGAPCVHGTKVAQRLRDSTVYSVQILAALLATPGRTHVEVVVTPTRPQVPRDELVAGVCASRVQALRISWAQSEEEAGGRASVAVPSGAWGEAVPRRVRLRSARGRSVEWSCVTFPLGSFHHSN